MADFAVRTVFTGMDKLSPAFKRMGAEADKFGKKGSGAMGRVNRAADSLMGTFKGLLPLFGVAAIANYASKAIELASSLTEVQNVVDTTFGKSSEEINKWSKNAITQFGLSELQAKQFTGSLGAMMKSSGLASDDIVKFSTNLSGLAGDFASFYDLPIEEAFEKIRSGISGETEPLKRLGINMSVANMEAFALTQGINKQWRAMSQAEQTQLRYAYLMKVSNDTQGDFNKTLGDSYANQKRVLGVQFDQALARMAISILPALTEAFKGLNSMMSAIDWESAGEHLKTVGKIILAVTGYWVAYKAILFATMGVQKIMIGIGWVKYLWMTIAAVLKATMATKLFSVAQAALNAVMAIGLLPILAIIAAVALLAGAAYLIYKNWEPIKEFFSGLWSGIVSGFNSAIDWIIQKFTAVVDWVANKWKSVKSFFGFGGDSAGEADAEMNRGRQAPNSAEVRGRAASTVVNVNNATPGTTATVNPRRGAVVNMNRVGANP